MEDTRTLVDSPKTCPSVCDEINLACSQGGKKLLSRDDSLLVSLFGNFELSRCWCRYHFSLFLVFKSISPSQLKSFKWGVDSKIEGYTLERHVIEYGNESINWALVGLIWLWSFRISIQSFSTGVKLPIETLMEELKANFMDQNEFKYQTGTKLKLCSTVSSH